MPATFSTSGGNTTVKMEWTVATAKAQAVIFAVAENLWVNELDEEGEVTNPFVDAEPQEKLDVAYKHVGMVLLNMADSYISNRDQDIARDAATKHDLGV